MRHYMDPTEAAFDRALEWVPKSGAKSGTREAQKGRGRQRRGMVINREHRQKSLGIATLRDLMLAVTFYYITT